ncbi:hypothetical protein GCK72_019800 [Caenorhabditis remanei]|uniref:Uncharacterized protein n=1 Tax=Caenorhabditis remanei TaxID=31234 RepID=A0A6A5GES8_CAERE|nr:hypothetical protein GCK72_019800 [Caenorhabditis remanei]KAF1753244.1 hypothetical protein GCK72_019800 [Caenorhabditis remanei]
MSNEIPIKSQLDLLQEADSIVRNSSSNSYVPRARFSFKDLDRCLVVIYTGVQRFLRMEFVRGCGGVVVHRSENSYNQEDTVSAKVNDVSPIRFASAILKSVIIDQSILIGALEIEFSDPDPQEQMKIFKEMTKVLGSKDKRPGTVFRAKKFITNSSTHSQIESYFHQFIIDFSVLTEVAMEGIFFETNYITPRKVFDTTEICGEMTLSETQMFMSGPCKEDTNMLMQKAWKVDGVATCRLLDKRDVRLWEVEKTKSTKLNRKVELKRVEAPNLNLVLRWNKSECGLWIHMVKMDREENYLEYFKNETCGLRWFCKKCSDPFDYWFYRNLPRRVYHEPQWTDIGYRPTNKKEIFDAHVINNTRKRGNHQILIRKLIRSRFFVCRTRKRRGMVIEEKRVLLQLGPGDFGACCWASATEDGKIMIHETDPQKIRVFKAYGQFRDIFVYEVEEKLKKSKNRSKVNNNGILTVPDIMTAAIRRAEERRNFAQGKGKNARSPPTPAYRKQSPEPKKTVPAAPKKKTNTKKTPVPLKSEDPIVEITPKPKNLISVEKNHAEKESDPIPTASEISAQAEKEAFERMLPNLIQKKCIPNSSEINWKQVYFYLFVLAPIYVPLICYVGSPLFDAIILFFKQLVM